MNQTKKIPISQIKPNPNNPRLIKDDNFKKLVKSITDFPEMGNVRPVVINTDGMILGGNMRFRAMKEAGITEIPVIQVDWTEEKQREFIIKDNVSGGEWDWEQIANDWDEQLISDWGLNIPVWADITKTNEVNNQDEWQGMPEFAVDDGSKKLIIQFDTDAERDDFVSKYEIKVNRKAQSAWSTWYPPREMSDISSLKYEE